MAKKILPKTIPFLLFIILAFFCGLVVSYLLFTYTNILPINYQTKFEQIYNSQPREQGWETYIDLVNGYTFNYPDFYVVNTGAYSPLTKNAYQVAGSSGLLHMNRNSAPALVKMYDSNISLVLYDIGNNKDLLSFAKENDGLYSEATGYNSTEINGLNTVIANFVMTNQLHSTLEGIYTKSNIEPVEYKRQTAYVQDKNFVYIMQSGSLYSSNQQEIFNKIMNSFKLLY